MPVKLLTSGGGGVNLVPSSSIASDQTMYLPTSGTSGGTVLCTDSTGGTANGVLYLNSSKQVTSGSGLVFDSSGNLGIGTSSPVTDLSIFGGTGSSHGVIIQAAGWPYYYRLGMNGTSGGDVYATTNYSFATSSVDSASYGTTFISQNVSGQISFGTGGTNVAPTERARIDSGGNLLVGRTVDIGNGILQVQGAANVRVALVTYMGATTAQAQVYFYNPNGVVGSISTSGSTTAYNTSSDYRLKENIQPMQNALDVVAQLNPVRYTWKADGSDGQGFIAHELQAVVPDCVTGEKDAVDVDGKPVYQGIDTSFLVATLTAAIQEQQAIIESLTQRIEALEYTKQGE